MREYPQHDALSIPVVHSRSLTQPVAESWKLASPASPKLIRSPTYLPPTDGAHRCVAHGYHQTHDLSGLGFACVIALASDLVL
jgi:hypothetical protein